MSTTTPKIRAEALKTLDGMERIIRTERLIHGSFAVDKEYNPCGKNKYCAVGAAVAGTGCRFKTTENWASAVACDPEGVDDSEDGAKSFLDRRPGLKVALAALNKAAAKRLRRRGWKPATDPFEGSGWRHAVTQEFRTEPSALEVYFEGELKAAPGRKQLLRVIASARKQIEKQAGA